MASLYVPDESLFASLADVWRLFVPDRSLERSADGTHGQGIGMSVFPPDVNGGIARALLYVDGELTATVEDDTQFLALREGAARKKRERIHRSKRALYRALSAHFDREMPWGALTGIRPSKLFRELSVIHGEQATEAEFMQKYLVSPQRTMVARELVRTQSPFIGDMDKDLAIYIGIPFCPGRCHYCSFVAQDVQSAKQARDGYLPALLREIQAVAPIAADYNVRSIYIGGGTPTTLSEEELGMLLKAVQAAFSNDAELTVEAGRPDTITSGKLDVLRQMEVDRICVNPQTTSDATLERIGRGHTKAQFDSAMLAAEGRFEYINCDVIAGLPGETAADMRSTIQDVLRFKPTNITVHALAIKNAAAFADDRYGVLPSPEEAAHMIATASALLREAGYRPYYLYRQKYMSGSLENIGWALPGTECVYNIANMEETASVLALGAGAISKRVMNGGARIERAANVKNALEYNSRLDEMIQRKQRLFEV